MRPQEIAAPSDVVKLSSLVKKMSQQIQDMSSIIDSKVQTSPTKELIKFIREIKSAASKKHDGINCDFNYLAYLATPDDLRSGILVQYQGVHDKLNMLEVTASTVSTGGSSFYYFLLDLDESLSERVMSFYRCYLNYAIARVWKSQSLLTEHLVKYVDARDNLIEWGLNYKGNVDDLVN